MIRIFIDDTGSPGSVSESEFDSNDAKTWVALLLNEDLYTKAKYEMGELLKDLQTTGAMEFHFTHILQGTKEFNGMELDERLAIINYFAGFFRENQFPLLIQTLASEDYKRSKIELDNKKLKKDNFKVGENADLALIRLLVRIKHYLKENGLNQEPFTITIDSGRQQGGTTQACSLFGDRLKDGCLTYQKSHEEPMLQLADFAAFMLNKQRLILTKKIKTDLEITLWEIFAQAQFNVLNMIKMYVPKNADTVKINDELIRKRYAETSEILPEITLSNLIEDYYRE